MQLIARIPDTPLLVYCAGRLLQAEHSLEFFSKKRAHRHAWRWRVCNDKVLPKPVRGAENFYGGKVWHRECGSKIAHQTIESALEHANEIANKPVHDTNGNPLEIYLCRWCDWFHIGHSSPEYADEGSCVWVRLKNLAGGG